MRILVGVNQIGIIKTVSWQVKFLTCGIDVSLIRLYKNLIVMNLEVII